VKFTSKQIYDAGFTPALVYYPTASSVFHKASMYGFYDTVCNTVQANVCHSVEGMARELCKSGCWTNEQVTRLETFYGKKEEAKILPNVRIVQNIKTTVVLNSLNVRDSQPVEVTVNDGNIVIQFEEVSE
jgi:hypothetical protein